MNSLRDFYPTPRRTLPLVFYLAASSVQLLLCRCCRRLYQVFFNICPRRRPLFLPFLPSSPFTLVFFVPHSDAFVHSGFCHLTSGLLQ